MIRVLIMIAVSGFVLAVATLTAAVAIGGPEAIARGGWHVAAADWENRHWGWDDDDWDSAKGSDSNVTRSFAWTGGDSLRVHHFPANVRYVQAEGPGSVTVTGPRRAVDRVNVDGGRIRQRRGRWRHHRLEVVVTAPSVSRFELSGASRLSIEDYNQDRLSLDMSGATAVTASGETRNLELDISGAGEADLSRLKTRDARVEISGVGQAKVAPTGRADLDISGMGDITLMTKPAQLETDISGAGQIHEAPAPAATQEPSKTST